MWQAEPGVSLGLEHRWWFWGTGSLGRGRGTSKVLFPISSVNSLYIFGSNDSVFTLFSRCLGTRPFVLSQHGSGGCGFCLGLFFT